MWTSLTWGTSKTWMARTAAESDMLALIQNGYRFYLEANKAEPTGSDQEAKDAAAVTETSSQTHDNAAPPEIGSQSGQHAESMQDATPTTLSRRLKPLWDLREPRKDPGTLPGNV